MRTPASAPPAVRNVFLAGPMGSGKSAVGRAVARRLGWRFVDTDAWVERRAGVSIAAIFAARGELRFRALERRAVRVACSGRRLVVALGGGALCDAANRRRLRGSGCLVALTCAQDELWRRLRVRLSLRPLLAGPRPRQSLRQLLARRQSQATVAHLRLSTTRRTPEQAARAIAAWLSGVRQARRR